jgi:hypothetical protein
MTEKVPLSGFVTVHPPFSQQYERDSQIPDWRRVSMAVAAEPFQTTSR